jgi:hypothetical protein
VQTKRVPKNTLEQLLAKEGLSHVDLMKVDIESFEYEALLGSRDVFRLHRVRALALKLHPTILAERDKDANDITKMLTGYGYRRADTFDNDVWLAP